MVSGHIQRGRRLDAATWTRATTRALPPQLSHAERGATVCLACVRACRLHEAQGCQGLSWSHNEPSITPTYVLDCARAARSVGLFTILVTNGLLTDAAIETLGPWLNVYRVDVKSRDDAFYRRIAGVTRAGDTLRIARRAQEEFGAHVEVVTNVMPGFNDSEDALTRIAEDIVASLGPNAPWNLTTYIPYALMRHVPATPLPTLERARVSGRRSGRRFISIDHPEALGGADTVCPTCGAVAIQRLRGRTRLVGVAAEGRCGACGERLNLVLPATPGDGAETAAPTSERHTQGGEVPAW